MAKKLRFTLPILAAFLFMWLCISPTFAAKSESPIIINVQHVYDTGVLHIEGENLSESTIMPVVTLNGVSLDVGLGPWDDKLVTATATDGWPEPGDYELLFDSTLKGTEPVKMMLTLGAVGETGADGADGADGDDSANGTDGTNGTDGAKGDKGDPGLSLPIACGSGEALNGIDEAGEPVCVPFSNVRVEGVWDDNVAVAFCPPHFSIVSSLSGVYLDDYVFFAPCGGTMQLYTEFDDHMFRCDLFQVGPHSEICLDQLKCVAVCEPT